MVVYKFGGASVNSASAVRNVSDIVKQYLQSHAVTNMEQDRYVDKLVVVVSAMGKSTNALEQLVPGICPHEEVAGRIAALHEYHRAIAHELLPQNDIQLQNKIDKLISKLKEKATANATTYNKDYDEIVCYGELLSTTIVGDYLRAIGIDCHWVDVREIIHTDTTHREGIVDWPETRRNSEKLKEYENSIIVTQGFIAGSDDGTTTLGREGSDYTAAILAHCLDASQMVIWKDVPGFLNADPKYFSDTVKIEQLPYNEAIEQAYYGASVIHPKTIKPLQNKGIELEIKSFVTPGAKGSSVGNYDSIKPTAPLYIVRRNQLLLSITPKDFSFIIEENLTDIFKTFARIGARINLMQNSALSFSVCIDKNEILLQQIQEELSNRYNIFYNTNLELITIRYYTDEIVDKIVDNREILLEQRSRNTTQLIVSER